MKKDVKEKKETTISHEEPAWKKRRREYSKARWKARMWTALTVLAIAAGASLLIFGVVRASRSADAHRKPKPTWGIATVTTKHVVTKNGKQDYVVTFRVSHDDIDKSVSRKDYDSLQQGQELKVEYTAESVLGKVELLHWERVTIEH